MVARKQDWTGTKIGELVVQGPTDKRKNRYMVWRCQCSCGNEVFLDTRALQRGCIRDCGCATKVRPGQRDLTGQRFGKLVCLEPTGGSKSGNVIWRCRCDCGNECTALRGQLTSGMKKSCGCLGHQPLKEYIGVRFGKLTVTEYAGKHNGEHQWRCQCDCGETTIVGQTRLQSGKTRSCGCIARNIGRDNICLVFGTSVKMIERALQHRLTKSNTSGHLGVSKFHDTYQWQAYIHFRRCKINLGVFDNYEDAVAAREQGEEFYKRFMELYNAGELTEDGIEEAVQALLSQGKDSRYQTE